MTTREGHHGGHRQFPCTRAGHTRVAGTVLAVLVVAGLLVGCSSSAASGAPDTAAQATGPSPSPGAPAPATSPSTAPGADATASDGRADVSPGYLDITRMTVAVASDVLTLGLDLADSVPTGSPAVGQLAYVFSLDVDGDGAWDYTATLGLLPGGGFQPTLLDRRSGVRLDGSAFPGTARLDGSHVSLTVRLDAIGCPRAIAVRGASEQTKGGLRAGDTVPDASDQWIALKTGCPG